MATFFISNFRVILSVFALLVGAFYIYGWGHADGYSEGLVACRSACEREKTITKEGQDDLQKRYDSVARKLAKRVPATCVIAKSANTPTSGARSMGNVGISTEWLDEQFANCSRLWHERIALEQFEEKVWLGRN